MNSRTERVNLKDCDQNLDYSLSGPNQTKNAIVYSQSLGARGLYSLENYFLKCFKK